MSKPESSAFGFPSKVGSGDTPPPSRIKNKRLCNDIYGDDSYPNCPMCDGSGEVWINRHWYSPGQKVTCDYCEGKGKLTWKKENDDTKRSKKGNSKT